MKLLLRVKIQAERILICLGRRPNIDASELNEIGIIFNNMCK
jgi:pyruvate/2-oxoglutarate dehydrogenase complex dihydrolipoamide dehydrogenase (E3) component